MNGSIRISHLPFYVGKGSKTRVTDHYRNSSNENPYTKRKLNKLKEGGFLPMYIKYNENSSEKNAFDEEIAIIKYIKHTFGDILTNMTEGGDNPPVHFGKDNNKSKTVYLYDKDTGKYISKFESCRQAALILGNPIGGTHISGCCNGKRRTYAGFKWFYEKFDFIKSDSSKFGRINFNKLIAYNNNEIYEFNSMKEAYDFLGVPNKGKINLVLKGKRNTYKGYNWKIR